MQNLISVERPARYTAGELNEIIKDHSKMKSAFAFCFPDVYEIGMSHLGMRIMYHVINLREFSACERVFAPWLDMQQKMLSDKVPLFSLETKKPLSEFDFIGFTLQYEMSYTNILNMLDLAGVPVKRSDRNDSHPFIIAGGPCTVNPSVMSDFIDLFVIGESEQVINEILDVYEARNYKEIKKNRRSDFLEAVSKIEGIYVPSVHDKTKVIKKRIISDLDKVPYPTDPIVPYIKAVHDRASLELFRGCIRGCRFCQAGYIYRPVRERSADILVKQTEQIIDSTGYEEIGLLSLSTSDYTELYDLCDGMLEITEKKMVNMSVPSMRIDNFSIELMNRIQKVRKSGLTFAPEAGSQRLRDVINKNLTEQEILNSVAIAKQGGYSNIKLYFMLGLPTETDEDVIAIADLTYRILDVFGRKNRVNITVSTAFFIPKPFTPFQWCPQIEEPEMKRRQRLLRDRLKDKRIKYNWHDTDTSVVESALSRGDEQTGQAVFEAWKSGCIFDSWNEHFNMEKWVEAFNKCDMDIYEQASRAIPSDATLPWDFIDIGVKKEYLVHEYETALKGFTTFDCRQKCTDCGAAEYGCGVCFENNQI